MNVLITGGAGFVGTHLTRRLVGEGCSVSVLDNFSPQVHNGTQELAPDLRGQVQLHRGDIRDQTLVSEALRNQDVVVHLAADTGTGQSMYEVQRYQDVNIGGTATLLNALVNDNKRSVRKIVLASSRAVYGEGQYVCPEHGTVYPGERELERLSAGKYEPVCPLCRRDCTPEATSEDCPINPLSFYGLTKYVQEAMVLMFARTCGLTGCALRYQNVYGPGQSLANPYTGILAIFSSLARTNSPMQIFEDGQESRDFIFIDDVVESTCRFIFSDGVPSGAYNIGSGERTTVIQVVNEIVRFFGHSAGYSVTGAFRRGDIRHNFANTAKTAAAIGFGSGWRFSEGVGKFLSWVEEQNWKRNTGYESSLRELAERGLLHG